MFFCKAALAATILLCASPLTLCAQDRQPNPPKTQTQAPSAQATAAPPAAKPADVATPDAVLAAIYDVISGPASQKRDWDRFRSLFAPGARLIPTFRKKDGSGYAAAVLTPEEYISSADPFLAKESFFEREAARKSERFGNIMQVFSTYESRHDAKDAAPFARGINSFQLVSDGARWSIMTILWEQETPETPLPQEFLHPAK